MPNERYHYPEVRLSADELERVGNLAQRHELGRVGMLGVDLEKYPSQGTYRLDGQRLPTRDIAKLATQIEPRFSEVVESVDDSRVTLIEQLLAAKRNVAVAFPHGPVTDIGVGFAALDNRIQNNGFVDYETGIIVSHTLQRMKLDFEGLEVAALEGLGFLFDRVYSTMPNSESINDSEFYKKVGDARIKKIRRTMLGDLGDWLDEGGKLMAISPSGTSDQIGKDYHALGTVKSGTARMLGHPKLMVQPVAVMLEGATPFVFDFAGMPRRIQSEGRAHEMMEELAATLDQNVSKKKFSYQNPTKPA